MVKLQAYTYRGHTLVQGASGLTMVHQGTQEVPPLGPLVHEAPSLNEAMTWVNDQLQEKRDPVSACG